MGDSAISLTIVVFILFLSLPARGLDPAVQQHLNALVIECRPVDQLGVCEPNI